MKGRTSTNERIFGGEPRCDVETPDVHATISTVGFSRVDCGSPRQRAGQHPCPVEGVVGAHGYDPVWGEIRFDQDTPDSVELDDLCLITC